MFSQQTENLLITVLIIDSCVGNLSAKNTKLLAVACSIWLSLKLSDRSEQFKIKFLIKYLSFYSIKFHKKLMVCTVMLMAAQVV